MDKKNFFAHSTAVIDKGAEIGSGTKIWHFCHLMAGAKVGENCILGQNVYVGGKAVIGNRVKIQNNVSVYDEVEIADDVFLGPSCVFTNVSNPRSHVERKTDFQKTKVEKGTTIGANATIVCGVTIGEYAFIGAGAVVIANVKPYALMVGVPAVQKGWVSRCGNKLDETYICPETGEKYFLENDQLQPVQNIPDYKKNE